jgi:hypothetical protein
MADAAYQAPPVPAPNDPPSSDAGVNYLLLDAAGYHIDHAWDLWRHPAHTSVLDVGIAKRLTSEQVCWWIIEAWRRPLHN